MHCCGIFILLMKQKMLFICFFICGNIIASILTHTVNYKNLSVQTIQNSLLLPKETFYKEPSFGEMSLCIGGLRQTYNDTRH